MQYFVKLLALLSLSICFQIHASQQALKLLKDNPNSFVLSADDNTCYGPLSPKQSDVAQEPDSFAFSNEAECLSNGGIGISTEELVFQQKKEEQETEFYGINWGLALAFVYMDQPRIADTTDISISENQIIHVNHQSKHRAIAMLESHYFFKTEWNVFDTEFGHGPFIAIGVTGVEGVDPLSTYGLGYMWGFKRSVMDNPTNTSWNIGVGMFIDTDVTQLRPQYADGDTTEITDINTLTYSRDETGLMVILSATF